MMLCLKAESTGWTAGWLYMYVLLSGKFLTSLRVSMLAFSFKNFPSNLLQLLTLSLGYGLIVSNSSCKV